MPWKISGLYMIHIKKNPRIYIILTIIFVSGFLAGVLAVSGLYQNHREELTDYIKGFMKIFDLKKVDNWTLFKVSLYRELKVMLFIWALGVSIIGIPVIFMTVLFRGFMLGFTLGTILDVLGNEGIVAVLSIVILKEMFLILALLAIAANGIMFSTDIIKSCSGKKIKVDNIKQKVLIYCVFALVQLIAIFVPVILEAVFLPVFIKF